jgi:drug/metabolite transporter (DMT)-like permease
LLAAAVLWSLSGVIVKSPPFHDLPLDQRGPVLACYRALFAAVCLLPLVRRRYVRWRPMLIPMVASFAGMNVLYVSALTHTTAAAAIFLQYTSTAWAFLFGYLFLGERIDRGNAVALVCSLCGIGWIVYSDWGGANFFGNLLALGSGFCYAGVVFCLRWLRDENSAWLVTLNHAASGLILLPWVLTLEIDLQPIQWGLIAFLGSVQMGLPYVLFATGVRFVRTQEAALLTLLEPILIPLWVQLAWGETADPAVWIGGALILGGLALRYTLFRPASPRRRE